MYVSFLYMGVNYINNILIRIYMQNRSSVIMIDYNNFQSSWT